MNRTTFYTPAMLFRRKEKKDDIFGRFDRTLIYILGGLSVVIFLFSVTLIWLVATL